MFRKILTALPFVAATALIAADAPPAMLSYIESDLMPLASDARVVSAIRAQNRQTTGLSQDEIIARDESWRAEVGAVDRPMIDAVLSAPLSAVLSENVEASQGRITEVFVMDSRGLNVASSAVTSDYWQGDEAKFQKSYEAGPGAVFLDEVELDESTQSYQGQVSIAVSDPASGEVIGAITIGLNASAFY